MAPGHIQLESGLADWSLTKGSESRETSLALGETVIKFGVSDRSEIAVDVTPYTRTSLRAGGAKASTSGFGDTTVQLKYRVTADGAAVQVALLPAVKIPTAKRDIGNGKVEAALLIPIRYSVPNSKLSVGATPELVWIADGDGHGRHAAMAQVVSLGWAATKRLSVSVDLWGQWDWDSAGTATRRTLDGSVAYLVSNDVQIDAGANLGLNKAAPDLELYAGASVRF